MGRQEVNAIGRQGRIRKEEDRKVVINWMDKEIGRREYRNESEIGEARGSKDMGK